MTVTIPEKYMDLFEKRTFADLATIMPDGSPQVTPIWIDFDGTHVLVNSAKGRLKDRNMRRDARVAVSMLDPENPYRRLQIRGRVVEITEEGADALIDKLAFKYLGLKTYPYRNSAETRVIYKIEPTHVSADG